MPIDHLAEFPLKGALLPPRLKALLEPVGLDPEAQVVVAQRYDADAHGPEREYAHYVMAVVPEGKVDGIGILREAGDGLVETSTPDIREKGGLGDWRPSMSDFDYVVAAWGDNSWFAFNLAEAVWMSLGLSPRCMGNETQKLVYDDLRLPEFGIAEGEVTTEFYWTSKRDVRWRMRNDYLRRYLWMRGAWGVRAFYYEAAADDGPELRALMSGEAHQRIDGKWFDLEIRERHGGGLLIQVAGTVPAVAPQLCEKSSANGIFWPGFEGPMTKDRANALVGVNPVYLDDRFLERYEQNASYDSAPMKVWNRWHCSPSYAGQWSFTECVRVGRNMVQVSMRELYKPKPDREILHAHKYVLRPDQVANLDPDEEPIVGKVARLAEVLVALAENLSWLAASIGLAAPPPDKIFGLSGAEMTANGWLRYPVLSRMGQVAPLDMSEQAFLARCKSIHELWQRLPNGLVRQILLAAGYTRADLKDLGSLKLLQGLLNVLERLNREHETVDAFGAAAEAGGAARRNDRLASLFGAHQLRIADAHETAVDVQAALQALGFDRAGLNEGYGRALDHVFDSVIAAFEVIKSEFSALRAR